MTTALPLFSIVVPAWNRGSLIGDTIRSLLSQDFPRSEYEIVVVDDGSTDDTVARLKAYSDRIRIYQQPHSGAASARNAGIRQASGQFIVSFDSDDILLPHALAVYKRAIDAFGQPPLLLAANPILFRTAAAIELASGALSRVKCIKCRDLFARTFSTAVTNSILILRKDAVLGVGGYSPESHEDLDLLFRLGNASPVVKIMQPPTVGYRLHKENATREPEYVTQGLLAFIRNERHGVFPGGSGRAFDRRGLIGGVIVWLCASYYLGSRELPLLGRLAHISRLLLHARGMVVTAFARRIRRRYSSFYSQEKRTLDYSRAQSESEPEMTDVYRRSQAEYQAWRSGVVS